MDKPKKYKIVLSKDALQDIKNTKTYILQTFMYREYAENFSKKIKAAIKALNPMPLCGRQPRYLGCRKALCK